MRKLSLLTTLLLISSMVHAGWITKGTDYKGDCLEMMCDCVEDNDGNGYCCPDGTSFNGKGDAHIEYTPCKCLEANTYYNTTSQKCSEKRTCNPCQKLDVATGTCVADTTKNNQAVGACGKCDNGSVITDRTKVTPCQTCNITNGTLTNKANGTQVQDVCHKCKDGNVVLKDPAKQFISNNTCVQCLANYGTGKTGACTTEAKPLCQNNVCQVCPSGYTWNNSEQRCVEKCPVIELYNYTTLAPSAERTKGAHSVAVIGPYECNYKLVMPWWNVDDYVCIQGNGIACKETGIDTSISHTVCQRTSSGCVDSGERWFKRYPISKPEVAYYLPAGKQIELKLVNVRYAHGGGPNSGLSVSAKLEPITDVNVTEKCGGGLFQTISSGRCDI